MVLDIAELLRLAIQKQQSMAANSIERDQMALLKNDALLLTTQSTASHSNSLLRLLRIRQRLLQSLYPDDFSPPNRDRPIANQLQSIADRLWYGVSHPAAERALVSMLRSFVQGFKHPQVTVHIANTNPFFAPGGLERYVLSSIDFASARRAMSSLLLYPQVGGEPHRLVLMADLREQFSLPAAAMLQVLAILHSSGLLRFHSLHIQHSMNWFGEDLRQTVELFQRIQVPVTMYFHDYFNLCPQHNLLFNGGEFCGPPPQATEGSCTECRFGIGLAAYRRQKQALCEAVEKLVTPSEATREIVSRIYPTLADKLEVVPYLSAQKLEKVRGNTNVTASLKPCLVFLGATGHNKGIERFTKLIERCGEKYRYATVGIEDYYRDNPLVTHHHFNFHEKQNLGDILDNLQPAIAFLGSNWPETFSYTLYESMESGLPVIATAESGNIAAQVRRNGNGLVFDSVSEMIEMLASAGDDEIARLLNKGQRFSLQRNDAGLAMLYNS